MLEKEAAVAVDLLWRVALLSAVLAADLVLFIALCRDEWREAVMRRAARRAGLRTQQP